MSHRSNRMEGAMSSGIVLTITLLVFLLVVAAVVSRVVWLSAKTESYLHTDDRSVPERRARRR